jgi:formate dehydrogenase subunit delta
METRDMVRMANQIGDFFKSYGEKEALEGIAEHINKFWEPRMRRQLFDIVDNHGGEGLDGLVLQAVPLIRRPPPAEVPPALANSAPAAH